MSSTTLYDNYDLYNFFQSLLMLRIWPDSSAFSTRSRDHDQPTDSPVPSGDKFYIKKREEEKLPGGLTVDSDRGRSGGMSWQ